MVLCHPPTITLSPYSLTLHGSHPPNFPQPRSSFPLVGLSIGSVLCILFFVGLTFYLAVGVAYRRRFRDAEWRDVVPNKEFWKAYPGLVKDGAVFLWTSVKDARGGYGYSVV